VGPSDGSSVQWGEPPQGRVTNMALYYFIYAAEQLKREVFNKGEVIPGYDGWRWRRDQCGLVMDYSEHGNRDSKNGWEIDHIFPRSRGGGDHIDNLQPLNWKTNVAKGDDYPNYSCPAA
jgi:HNH endonuclease